MINNAVEIKKLNKERIVLAIQNHETVTKANLVAETSLSMATCSTFLNALCQDGEVLAVDRERSIVGRPTVVYRYNADFVHILVITAGKSSKTRYLQCAVINGLGVTIQSQTFPLETVTYHSIEQAIFPYLRNDPKIAGIGIGVPGIVNQGSVENCALEELNDINLIERLEAVYQKRVFVINDVNAAAYHLYRTKGDSGDSMAAIYFPYGGYVGCGTMINGHLHTGATMFSGEFIYLARAFGITKEEQIRIWQNKDTFVVFASQVLTSIICTINPSTVVLLGEMVTEENLKAILADCKKYFPARHIPKLSIEENFSSAYLNGVADYTRDHIQFPYTSFAL